MVKTPRASTAGDAGLIPGQGTKILHAAQPKQTNKQKTFLSITYYLKSYLNYQLYLNFIKNELVLLIISK